MRSAAACFLTVMGLVLGFAAVSNAAEPEGRYAFRKTILNPRMNLMTPAGGGFSLANTALPGIKTAPWSVKTQILHGGKQEGVTLIHIDNGAMVVTLIAERGLGVLEARTKSGHVRLGWDSPVKEIVNPAFVNLESRGGLGWIEAFTEGMVRCGLEFAGHPGLDEFIDNTGAKAQMNLTLHGKIANIPASAVEVLVDAEPPHRMRVRGSVNERLFFGPKLELVAEVSTVPGSTTFRIDDSITNHGAAAQEFQLIYHANYGSPVLQEGASFLAPVAKIAPMNDSAA
jgi:hypothetical protein